LRKIIITTLFSFILISSLSCLAYAKDYIIIRLVHRQADEILEIVEPLLSDEGKISVDANTNSIIVVDRAENLSEIEMLIKSLDVVADQVKIEMVFFEESKDTDINLQVDWKYSDKYYIIGNLIGAPGEKGLFLKGVLGAGYSGSERVINQTLLVISGSEGRFVTGKSVPTNERLLIYFRKEDILIEGRVFRDVKTGFIVSPNVMGNNIRIDIKPFMSYFTDEGEEEIIFYEADTSIVTSSGETVVIAENSTEGKNVVGDILSGFSGGDESGNFYIAITPTVVH
jgi:hypothetical protein